MGLVMSFIQKRSASPSQDPPPPKQEEEEEKKPQKRKRRECKDEQDPVEPPPKQKKSVKKWRKVLPSYDERTRLKNIEQNSEEWMDERLGIYRDPETGHVIRMDGAREGASSTGVLCGWSKYELPRDKWRLYTGKVVKPPMEDTFFCDHGHKYEDAAQDIYTRTVQADLGDFGEVFVENRGIYVDLQHPELAASPDFVAYFNIPKLPEGKSYGLPSLDFFSRHRFCGNGEIKCTIFGPVRSRRDKVIPHSVKVEHIFQMHAQSSVMRDQPQWELRQDVLDNFMENNNADGQLYCDYVSHWRKNERKERGDLESETFISRMYYNIELGEAITNLRLTFIKHCEENTEPERGWWYHAFKNYPVTVQPMYHLRDGVVVKRYFTYSPLKLTLEEWSKR